MISIQGMPAKDGELELKPFNVTHNSDMKAAWYLSNRGGGCKTTTFFCTLCPCTKDTLISFKVDDLRCDCCNRGKKSKCYHHDVCDSITVSRLLSDLEAELGDYYKKYKKQYDVIKQKS